MSRHNRTLSEARKAPLQRVKFYPIVYKGIGEKAVFAHFAGLYLRYRGISGGKNEGEAGVVYLLAGINT